MPDRLIRDNRAWAEKITAEHPDFFTESAKGQSPQYFWIGCADSRVPESVVVDRMPGQLFVQRNVANQVIPTDLSLLASMQYAVDVLKVEHIVVCGHYACGGVQAALTDARVGLVDSWLQPLRDLRAEHQKALEAVADEAERVNLLSELSVITQVREVARTNIVRDAWNRGQQLGVHGFAYVLSDGLLKDLGASIEDESKADEVYRSAIQKALASRAAS